MTESLKGKYTVKALQGISTDDFYYDITIGGYINPSDILLDSERVKKIEEAIKIIEDWEQELYDDGILDDLQEMENKYVIEIVFKDDVKNVVGVGRPSTTDTEIQVLGADDVKYTFNKSQVLYFTVSKYEE